MASGLRAGSVARTAPRDLLLWIVVAAVGALVLSQGLTSVSFRFATLVVAAVALFVMVFLRTDFGIYIVIFSMLLSPEFGAGGGLAEKREVVLRSEDFLLLVIGFSWFAKTAVNKELGLVAKTPLNRPIFAYVASAAIATLVGALAGSVRGQSGFFYVLKYVEYFVVYYMVVNNLRDREQAWRFVTAAFLTAAIVSVIGAGQIPTGQRVSAPFEGKEGEPNTFGGYLLLMMSIAAGIALETPHFSVRLWTLGVMALMSLPFAFTLSRASYLGLLPAMLTLTGLTTRRKLMVGLLLMVLVLSPILAFVAPKAVVNRVLYTFQPEAGQPTVTLGRLGLDPSTSARFVSFNQAAEGWMKRPFLGWGVTGFGFMDSQYARALVETGAIGLMAFFWLVWALLRSGRSALGELRGGDERGLALGFLAGTTGLLAHAFGANTFIIVRIMEPFWFFAGIVVMLPLLEREEGAPATA
ncbi:MAG: O-antigen ligase family protein [Candidatus Rokubacteria bacterium]|nr:O-antigen ligase family protein [Candidatus Rokubacteria bacterium]